MFRSFFRVRPSVLVYVLSVAFLTLAASVVHGVTIDIAQNAASVTKPRYNVGDPFSGVGQLHTGVGGCTAQPISKTVIISAAHCSSATVPGSFSIKFYDAPDVLIAVTR